MKSALKKLEKGNLKDTLKKHSDSLTFSIIKWIEKNGIL